MLIAPGHQQIIVSVTIEVCDVRYEVRATDDKTDILSSSHRQRCATIQTLAGHRQQKRSVLLVEMEWVENGHVPVGVKKAAGRGVQEVVIVKIEVATTTCSASRLALRDHAVSIESQHVGARVRRACGKHHLPQFTG